MNKTATTVLYNEIKGYLFDSFTSISGVKEIFTIGKIPFLIKDAIFLKKLELFINGIPDVSINDFNNLTEDEQSLLKENLINTLDKIDCSNKIEYFIKLFNSLHANEISFEDYYRLNTTLMNLTPFEISFFLNLSTEQKTLQNFLALQGYQSLDDFKEPSERSKYYIDEIKESGIFDPHTKYKDFYISNNLFQHLNLGIITGTPYLIPTPLGKLFKKVLK